MRLALTIAIGLIGFAADVPLAADPTFVVSCSGERSLNAYSIDAHGTISQTSRTPMESKPAASCFDAVGRHLYVAGTEPTTINVFRSEKSGLTQLQSVAVPGKPSYLSLTPSGDFLLASYFASGQVTAHRIVGEGRLSETPLQMLDTDPHPHCITCDPSGQFVFVTHTSVSRISQFRFNDKTGELTPNDPLTLQRQPGVAPRHLRFHPNGRFAFTSNERGRSMSVYDFAPELGQLSERETLSSLPDQVDGNATTSRVEVHPSGKFVYIANRGHGSIGAFTFDAQSRKLKLLQLASSQSVVRSFGISPDGRFLVAAGQKSGKLDCFQISEAGLLSLRDSALAGKTPWWVTFSPTHGLASVPPTNTNFSLQDRSLTLGQGTMSGEVGQSSVLLQTRLTLGNALDEAGDLAGGKGVVQFEWATNAKFTDSQRTPIQDAVAEHDFVVRAALDGLQPNTTYYYRAIYGPKTKPTHTGPTCSFSTLPGPASADDVKFIVGSCMNYVKFMHGRAGNASGPLTATAEDKQLGFPAFATMAKLQPQFFVGTGDIVYYDNPFRVASSMQQLRKCWHEQFRFPRLIEFFKDVPCYWSKDDHDFRYNDSDNETEREPLPKTGIDVFREQLPITSASDTQSPTYRTMRVSKNLQIWLTEGRDHRSANKSPDGPEKTLWGEEQRKWLQSALAKSDAKWKIMINPTPMVGPDDAYKSDNHANLQGFRHEADAFFAWVQENQIENLVLVCGDRHWQYHSVHPTGVNEFACGALNDENSRMGVAPGEEFGSDPDGKIQQLFTSPEPSGGFLQIEAGERLRLTHFTDDGQQLYQTQLP